MGWSRFAVLVRPWHGYRADRAEGFATGLGAGVRRPIAGRRRVGGWAALGPGGARRWQSGVVVREVGGAAFPGTTREGGGHKDSCPREGVAQKGSDGGGWAARRHGHRYT